MCEDRNVAVSQIEQMDFAGNETAIARPAFQEGNPPSLGIHRRAHDLPARFVKDRHMPRSEIETGEFRIIPAALAGIGRATGNGLVLAQQGEFPDAESPGSYFLRLAAVSLDTIEPPARLGRIGDGRVFL